MPGKESKRPKRKGDAGEGEEADLEENKFVVMRHSSGVGESPVAKEAEQYLTDHNGQAVPIGTPGVRGYIMPFAEEQGYFEVWSEPAGTLPNIMSTIRDRGGRLILVDSEYHRTRPSPFIAPLLNLAAVKHFAETGTLEERKYTGVWVTAPKYPLGQVLTRQQAQERYRQHAFEAAELAIKAIAGLTLAAAAESAEEHIAISTSSAAVQLDESSASASTSESSSSPSSSVKTAHDGSVQPNTIAVNPPARKSGVVEGELRFTKRKPEDSVADKTATKPQPVSATFGRAALT